MDHPAKAPGVSFATLTVVEPARVSAASYSLSIKPGLCFILNIALTASPQLLLAAASVLACAALIDVPV